MSAEDGASGGRGGPLLALRRFTPARVAMGRVGASLPTSEVLAFGLAHARARDAVHAALDVDRLARDLAAAGGPGPDSGAAPAPVVVRSAAGNRATYLARPDLGRRLAPGQFVTAARDGAGVGAAIVVADGLSAIAAQRHAAPVVAALRGRAAARWGTAPIVMALQGRVALGDEVGAALGARLVVVLIGERPGLASPDSLGAYLTFEPRPGRTDAERNCISNIRVGGLTYAEAALRIDMVAAAALERGLTGVGLEVGAARLRPPQALAMERRAGEIDPEEDGMDGRDAVMLQDSARRRWRFELRQDPTRGRYAVFSPVQGDLEPFRASPDGYRPEAYLRIDAVAWTVFEGLAERPDDEALQREAHRVFDRMVREAQHQSLLGAAEDDDED